MGCLCFKIYCVFERSTNLKRHQSEHHCSLGFFYLFLIYQHSMHWATWLRTHTRRSLQQKSGHVYDIQLGSQFSVHFLIQSTPRMRSISPPLRTCFHHGSRLPEMPGEEWKGERWGLKLSFGSNVEVLPIKVALELELRGKALLLSPPHPVYAFTDLKTVIGTGFWWFLWVFCCQLVRDGL